MILPQTSQIRHQHNDVTNIKCNPQYHTDISGKFWWRMSETVTKILKLSSIEINRHNGNTTIKGPDHERSKTDRE